MSELQTIDVSQVPEMPLPVLPISEQAQILEAVLFAAPEPMTPHQLMAAVPGSADLGAALGELRAIYSGRGVALKEIDGKWAFRTSDIVAPHLVKFRSTEKKLSRAALETLAIIAYHQPVTRTEIENIRGVVISKGTLDQLMELGWIKPGKRREILGRPLTWVTTSAFLDHFGLSGLNDLPGVDDLKASGLLDARPAIETIDLFGVQDAEIANDAGVRETEDAEDLEMLPSLAPSDEVPVIVDESDVPEVVSASDDLVMDDASEEADDADDDDEDDDTYDEDDDFDDDDDDDDTEEEE